jgi:hypothetical protein
MDDIEYDTMSCPACGELMHTDGAIPIYPIPGTIYYCRADDCDVGAVIVAMKL